MDKFLPTVLAGVMVPKRHARRSVTRSLLKRQMRGALIRHDGELQPGYWLVRLRAPFPVARFPSAASPALASVVHEELEGLLSDMTRRQPRPGHHSPACAR